MKGSRKPVRWRKPTIKIKRGERQRNLLPLFTGTCKVEAISADNAIMLLGGRASFCTFVLKYCRGMAVGRVTAPHSRPPRNGEVTCSENGGRDGGEMQSRSNRFAISWKFYLGGKPFGHSLRADHFECASSASHCVCFAQPLAVPVARLELQRRISTAPPLLAVPPFCAWRARTGWTMSGERDCC